MMLRVGMSRQQYQRLESKGNPRLDNLELLAKGLKMELMLIPQEKLQAVKAALEGKAPLQTENPQPGKPASEARALSDDPWKDILADNK